MLSTISTYALPAITRLAPVAMSNGLPALAMLVRRNHTAAARNIFEPNEEDDVNFKSKKRQQQPDDKPWDGEEPVKHSVLRMIMDKYSAPLRVEGAARRNIPQPQSSYVPPPPQKDEKSAQLKKQERELKAAKQKQNRIVNAKETAFDYAMNRKYPVDEERAHLTDNITSSQNKKDIDWEDWDLDETPRSINELGVLSDAIFRSARARGEFDHLPGRGKPLKEDPMVNNPYVDRTEYFLNRIIQRNGAAPPWVMMQQEVDTEVTTVRSQINNAVKRCMEEIKEQNTSVNQKSLLKQFEKMEKSFFAQEMERINKRVRSYNVMCPAPVRKPLLELNKELEATLEKYGLKQQTKA